MALAVRDLLELPLDAMGLATAGRRAENEVRRARRSGSWTRPASLLGEAGHALLLDCRSLAWRHVPLDAESAGLRLLVIDSRVTHALADGQYAERRRSCTAAAEALGIPALRDVTAGELAEAADRLLQTCSAEPGTS